MKTITILDPDAQTFQYIEIDHDNYKYEMAFPYTVELDFVTGFSIVSEFYMLTPSGFLTIKKGYAWDGASGPTIDTMNTMRASCVHDVLYQMMRERYLSTSWKDAADLELQRLMIEDGFDSSKCWNKIRAGYYYWGVRIFGGMFCKPGS